MQKGWHGGASVSGNLWRTDDDIRDDYYTMAELGFGQSGLEQFAGRALERPRHAGSG